MLGSPYPDLHGQARTRASRIQSEGCHLLCTAGILEPQQYDMTEHISVNASWEEGRAVLKLWLKDPMRYEA